MYASLPAAARAWRALFSRVFAETGVDVRWIEHRWPEPIAALWQRDDLACDFMCGWPFVRSERGMQPIAAPVPSPPRYAGLPRYCSEFLVRESSGWTTLEQTFARRIGWMAADSQSGFNAPRAHLSRFVTPQRRSLYAASVGPLGSPLATLDALHAGTADVVALDSYFLDLCRRHEPARLSGLRCVATTDWTPIPLLVAAPGIDGAAVAALRSRLPALHTEAPYAELLDDALVARFVVPDVADYAVLQSMARRAAERGYGAIA
jgi:ABC-type phosphate/phosphonate transport system substrate-binding protein